jgi:hypothetical protein
MASLMPYWWDPLMMDRYFKGTLAPLPETVVQPTLFLRRHTEPRAVVASDPAYSQWIAALGARRVLFGYNMSSPPRMHDRIRIQEQLLRGELSERLRVERESFGIRYLLVTNDWLLRIRSVSLDDLLARTDLALVHMTGQPDGNFVAIFRFVEESA